MTNNNMLTTYIPAAIPAEAEPEYAFTETVHVEPVYTPPPFRLEVGNVYRLASRTQTMQVIYEHKNKFLGIVLFPNGPIAYWYLADGTLDRDLDKFPDQDPFDVIGINREPDVIYLLRINGDYTSNNCFMSRDAAVKAAQARGGEIVSFVEQMDR